MGFAMAPNALLQAMNRPSGANYNNPQSILSAMMGTTPDVRQGYSQGGTSFQTLGGSSGSGSPWDQAVSGGGGGGSHGYMFGSPSQSQEFGTSGQSAKIAGLGEALGQSYKQNRFTAGMGALGGVAGQINGYGGQSTPAPGITVGPVWTPQQIQGQVNQVQAGNNANAQSQQRDAGRNLAGHGFGSQSPLLAALNQGYGAQANMANSQAAQQIPWNAAQGNAQQVLASQTEQGNLWNQANQQDIARKQLQAGMWNQYMAAVSGMV